MLLQQAGSNIVAGLIQWKTSRINTTTAKVWSGVVSKSNAIDILLTETGRNTGVFNGIVNLFDNENTSCLRYGIRTTQVILLMELL